MNKLDFLATVLFDAYGATASMLVYSMIETAKANEIDPLEYQDISLRKLIGHRNV